MSEGREPGDMYRSKIEEIAVDQNEVDERASGREKTVYNLPHDSEHVVGVFHEHNVKELNETPRQIKARYYLTKILHLLFPRQVPNIHLASSNPPTIVVDKVNGQHSQIMNDKNELDEFARQIENLGASVDYAEYNFKRNELDDLVYVDSFKPWIIWPEHNPTKIGLKYSHEALLKAIGRLDSGDQKTAVEYLRRLEDLFIEEKKALKDGTLYN